MYKRQTRGEPKVTDIIPGEGIAKDALVRTALVLELKSEHPLAKAIVVYGEEQKIAMTAADEFQVMPGNGLSGLVSGVRVFGGSLNFISEKSTVSKNIDVYKRQEHTYAISDEVIDKLY